MLFSFLLHYSINVVKRNVFYSPEGEDHPASRKLSLMFATVFNP